MIKIKYSFSILILFWGINNSIVKAEHQTEINPDTSVAKRIYPEKNPEGFFDNIETNHKYSFPFQNTYLPSKERAIDLVSRMTLEQKISQMKHSAPAIDTFGIPAYNWWNECLHGVGRAGFATVFPQAIGMASTWNKDLIFQIANTISDEARAKHHHFASLGKRSGYMGLTFWTPNINIVRDPRWGRGQETYGEDPFLTSEIANQFIRGLQGNDPKYLKLVATAKHYAVHSGPESLRHEFDISVSDKDLHETYLPAFKSAIKDAHVESIMCAYNSFRGIPCCGNNYILSDILRNQWGFDGYIVSDCGAIADIFEEKDHHYVETPEDAAAVAVKAGTDLNCGNIYPYLKQAVLQGIISEEEVDQALIRLFTARFKLGMFDDPCEVKYANIPYNVVGSRQHKEIALQASRESIVLLKNENNILPLSKEIKSIAVIGPNANDEEVMLGNYNGTPNQITTVLEGIRQKLPNAAIHYADGSPLIEGYPLLNHVPSNVLSPGEKSNQTGLKGSYFISSNFILPPARTQIDSTINFNWIGKSPISNIEADSFGVKWEGFITAPVSGEYIIGLNAASKKAELYLEDSLVIKSGREAAPTLKYLTVNYQAGQKISVRIEYFSTGADPQAHLLWSIPNQDLVKNAIDAANKSDAVVMIMGLHPMIEGEQMPVSFPGFNGGDRTNIELPAIQQNLIRKIHDTGKPVILVFMGGSNIAFNWEHENINGILYAWYPGEYGGRAVADVIFGDYNPSGKLPVTFYKSTEDLPPFTDYSMEYRTYKYFTGEVLYPFGYGLSYTQFEYDNLSVPKRVHQGDTIEVSVRVKNTGTISGKEVVQVYLKDIKASFRVPVRSLRSFKKIFLEPGESKEIRFILEPDDLGMYNDQGELVIEPGKFEITAGGGQPGFKEGKQSKYQAYVSSVFRVK